MRSEARAVLPHRVQRHGGAGAEQEGREHEQALPLHLDDVATGAELVQGSLKDVRGAVRREEN